MSIFESCVSVHPVRWVNRPIEGPVPNLIDVSRWRGRCPRDREGKARGSAQHEQAALLKFAFHRCFALSTLRRTVHDRAPSGRHTRPICLEQSYQGSTLYRGKTWKTSRNIFRKM